MKPIASFKNGLVFYIPERDVKMSLSFFSYIESNLIDQGTIQSDDFPYIEYVASHKAETFYKANFIKEFGVLYDFKFFNQANIRNVFELKEYDSKKIFINYIGNSFIIKNYEELTDLFEKMFKECMLLKGLFNEPTYHDLARFLNWVDTSGCVTVECVEKKLDYKTFW
jgi:hypothetical protein